MKIWERYVDRLSYKAPSSSTSYNGTARNLDARVKALRVMEEVEKWRDI